MNYVNQIDKFLKSSSLVDIKLFHKNIKKYILLRQKMIKFHPLYNYPDKYLFSEEYLDFKWNETKETIPIIKELQKDEKKLYIYRFSSLLNLIYETPYGAKVMYNILMQTFPERFCISKHKI